MAGAILDRGPVEREHPVPCRVCGKGRCWTRIPVCESERCQTIELDSRPPDRGVA